jgi:tetratricopeptide (TPR) repeat protein/serine/threonine protein kinase
MSQDVTELTEAPPRSAPSASQDDPRLVAILEEYRALLETGKKPDREQYLRRCPDLAASLKDCFDGLEFIFTVAPDIREANNAAAAKTPAASLSSIPLGDYRVVREIGRGGMGVVYEAEQMLLGRRVALKVLPFAATMDTRQLQRFHNEARAAACLHHPHIVPVHAVGCERGVHYYAMQFIEGQSLAQVLEDLRRQECSPHTPCAEPGTRSVPATMDTPAQARLSTQLSQRGTGYFHAVAHLGIQAAEALQHAHELGVIHRDIKPANLLVDGRGNAWVTDFGLAQIQGDKQLTLTGDLVGTLRYMSPEQALAKRVVIDHRTDIYSLAATLYELLTLEPVFSGGDRQELLRQIAFEEPKPPRRHSKSMPAELETIVLKALEKNPADRYATAKEMADDLERFAKDEPIRARRPSVSRRLRGWCRRHKPLVSGFAVLVVTLFLVGAAGLWWQENQREARERQRGATAAKVLKDLEAADFWQKHDQWPKALEALAEASGRLQGNGLDSLQEQVEERRRQASLVAELNDAQVKASEAYADGTRDFNGADKAYARAFAEHGLDVAALPADEISRSIRESAICGRLVAALDHWAYVKECLLKGNGETLRAIAQSADDDNWRKQLRNPGTARNLQSLKRLAEEEGALKQSSINVLLLCYLLDRLPGTPGPWSPEDKATRDKAWAITLRLLRQAQKRYPGDFWLNFELGARLSQQAESLAEAVGFFRAALAVQTRSPIVYNSLGLIFERQGKLAEAVAAYRQAIDCKHDNACAYCNLGVALHNQKNLSGAVEAYNKAIDIKRDFFLAYNNLGNVLHDQQKLAQAEKAYRKAIELQPKYSVGYYNLGNLLRETNKPEAVKAYRKAIELQPNYPQAYINLGIVLYDQHKFCKAEDAYREAIRIHPFAEAYINLGNLLKDQHKLPDAEAAYRKAIELKPDDAHAHTCLGSVLREQRRLPEAEHACRKAIALKPDYAEAYLDLGNVLFDQQNLPAAVDAFSKAIELKRDFGRAYANLGLVLINQGKLPEAEKAYQEAINLNIRNENVYINLAAALEGQGKLIAAADAYREATKLYPPSYLAYNNLGIFLAKREKLFEAADVFRKSIEIKDDSPESHANLGRALLELGRFKDCLHSLKRAHELGSRPDMHQTYADLVRQAERLIRKAEQFILLEPNLPKILKREVLPADAAERLTLAALCQLQCRQLYAAAARFYREAFKEKPELGNNLAAGNRYDAACVAARAASAKGKDADLDPKDHSDLRGQALAWLKADLKAWQEVLAKNPTLGGMVGQKMQRWQEDTDFDGVRGAALAKLPEAERQDWRRLWEEVEELKRRAIQLKE